MQEHEYGIEEKELAPLIVGGIRMRGRYSDCGPVYKQLGRRLGRHMKGKPLMLCYDEEAREEDADFEPCLSLKRIVEAEGIHVRELAGGRCISLIHRGPYENFTPTYCRLIEYAREKGYELANPSREVYVKGPGLLFKGNPKKYLTEIQFLIVE